MEAGYYQDLRGELAGWRPRRADGVVVVQVHRPENWRTDDAVLVPRLTGLGPSKS